MPENIFSLPLDQKVGQLFFIGLPGTELDADAERLLRDISPGGVCLFARNIRQAEQTKTLLDRVREILPIAPLLSLDQEGGLVDRLRRVVEPMPAASSLRSVEQVQRLADLTAETVRMLGFNMNFAPVIDVVDEERGRFTNGLVSRTLGRSKEEATRLAASYLQTLQDRGCLGCLKHFPGIGASQVDSHEELPAVRISADEFRSVDLFPYRQLLPGELVRAVMVGHAAFPGLDLQEFDSGGKLLPSSLSFNFISELLRGDLDFQGLVLTDDLEMGAILRNYPIGEACRMAVAAGQDMLLICNNTDLMREGFETVLEAVRSGLIPEERLDNSLQRIAAVKNLISEPLSLEKSRLAEISAEIADLKAQLQ